MTRVDGHAHFHADNSLDLFLQSAVENLLDTDESVGVLLLAHIGSEQPLTSIRKSNDLNRNWTRSEPDSTSLLFRRDDGFSIVVIAGRQIVTAEKLELLTLCTDQLVPSGMPVRESIQMASSQSAIPVVPWGFGKWWFSRGKVLRDLIQSDFEYRWLIGDSGCRVRGLIPPMIAEATKAGIATVAGSDPLPLESHRTRVGSYGSVLNGTIDLNRPTEWMRDALRNLDSAPAFGQCRSLSQFLRDQIGLRIA